MMEIKKEKDRGYGETRSYDRESNGANRFYDRGSSSRRDERDRERYKKRVLILWRYFLNVSVLQVHLLTMHVHLKNHKNFDGAQKSKFIILKIFYLSVRQ